LNINYILIKIIRMPVAISQVSKDQYNIDIVKKINKDIKRCDIVCMIHEFVNEGYEDTKIQDMKIRRYE
jgi:hypothetical protein